MVEEDILRSIFVSQMNLVDIEKAKNAWGKYWDYILTDPTLLTFEKEALRNTHKRELLVGIDPKKSLASYEITDETFSKLISKADVELYKSFFSKESKFIPKLVEIRDHNDHKSWVVMENLCRGTTPKFMASLVMHQVTFDPEILEEERDYREMGTVFFELRFGVQEMISTDPAKYL